MDLPISLQVFLILESLLLRTDCKVIENASQKSTISTPETTEVLNWVKNVKGMDYHPGINDPGEMLIVQHHCLYWPYFLAVLITGGTIDDGALQSAEIYHPDQHTPCVLSDLPYYRYHHTQDGSLLCGGWLTRRSCRRWNADTGAWDVVTESLTKYRYYHTSWTPVDGSVTYLMGAYWSPKASEAIDQDNVVTSSFPLQHKTE